MEEQPRGDKYEPLLDKTLDRLILFPIQHDDIWKMYKNQLASFWVAEEICLQSSVIDFNTKLTANEQHYIKMVLAFFASSDTIVNENIAQNFLNEVQYPEAKFVYQIQLFMEGIHSESYALQIDTLISDKEEKQKLFRSIESSPIIKRKADFCFKYINADLPFVDRLIAFSCVEGIFFSSSFAAIFYMKKRSLLAGLVEYNQLISRDEANHVEFCYMLLKHIRNRPTQARITQIVQESVEIETEFVQESLPSDLIGINSKMMTQYLQFVADRHLQMLGCPKIYLVENPFEWMDMISMESKTNFFENRVTQYKKANVDRKREDYTFTTQAEF